VALVLAVLGAIAGIIAFTTTDWFDGSGKSHFGDISDGLDQLDKLNLANGLSVQYFSWLAWVVLAVAAVAAVVAALPSPASTAMRVLGVVAAVAGIVLTFLAIRIVSKDNVEGAPDGYGEYLKHALKAPAFYFAAGGYLLIGIAAALGPRRNRA
jgi:hypothetical protein